jgi:sugar lactone lactonase YvrE
MRLTRSGAVSVFAEWAGETRLFVPNFPVFDAAGDLWVSNSFDRPIAQVDFAAQHANPEPLATLVRLRPDGSGETVVSGLYLANGLAIDPSEEWIYVLQSTRENTVRLALDGVSREVEPYGPALGGFPDGMAFDAAGNLIITQPSDRRLVELAPDGTLTTIAEDPGGELMPRPTNCAFAGDDFRELLVANMEGDHFSALTREQPGHPLFNRRD